MKTRTTMRFGNIWCAWAIAATVVLGAAPAYALDQAAAPDQPAAASTQAAAVAEPSASGGGEGVSAAAATAEPAVSAIADPVAEPAAAEQAAAAPDVAPAAEQAAAAEDPAPAAEPTAEDAAAATDAAPAAAEEAQTPAAEGPATAGPAMEEPSAEEPSAEEPTSASDATPAAADPVGSTDEDAATPAADATQDDEAAARVLAPEADAAAQPTASGAQGAEANAAKDANAANEADVPADSVEEDAAVAAAKAGAEDDATKNTTQWKRLAGATALDTMKQIVQEGFDAAQSVVIATTNGYQDALTASSLAGAKDAPILLTDPKKLSAQTSSEIKRLGAKNAYVIGGTKAISPNVVDAIKKLGLAVRRVAGQTAAQTAVAVADQLGSKKSSTCFVATANGYQDALSASPYAYATHSPIFLATSAKGKSGQATLDKETLAAITKGGYSQVVIVGGTSAISKNVEGQLKGIGVSKPERVAGKTAYDTSKEVAEWGIDAGMSREAVVVATGTNYQDAVMGAALAGSKNAPMVLVEDANRTAAANVYRKHIPEVKKGYILGGTKAVTRVTEEYLKLPIGAASIVAAAQTIDDGLYTLGFKKNTSFSAGVAAASTKAGANVQLYANNSTLAQKWQITWTGNGYSIRNLGTGRALAVTSMKNGANVAQVAYKAKDAAQLWSISKTSSGGYVLRNMKSGMALDVAGAKAANGTNVRAADITSGASQQYTLKKTEALVDGGVYTFYVNNKTLAMDEPGMSRASGKQMQLYKSNGSIAQKFVARRLGADTFALQPVATGYYLEDKGGRLVQSARTGKATQQWTVKLASVGSMLVNVGTGNAIDAAAGKKNGAKVGATTAANKGSQQFVVAKVDPLANGIYTLANVKSGNLLDVAGGRFNNRANIGVAKKNGNPAQAFKIVKVGNYYRITSALTGRAVEVAGGAKRNGANVQQYDSNGSAAQLWKAEVSKDGGIVFVNKASGKVLDVAGGSTKSGANVQQYTSNGTAAQRWLPAASTYKEVPAIARAANKIMNSSSRTRYFMTVDLTNHQVVIFKGSKGNWTLQSNSICSVGKPSTPTVTGDFTVGSRGYSFGHGYTCYYWTQIYGGYLFHSTKYKEGTFIPSDPRLGKDISMGCVRLPIDYAKWINRNIPTGTHIRIYR